MGVVLAPVATFLGLRPHRKHSSPGLAGPGLSQVQSRAPKACGEAGLWAGGRGSSQGGALPDELTLVAPSPGRDEALILGL